MLILGRIIGTASDFLQQIVLTPLNTLKRLLYTIAALLIAASASASHLMGGEITARQLSGYNYEVTLTVYRDTLGISIAPGAFFSVADTSGTILFDSIADLDLASSGVLMPLFPYGVEVYRYREVITFPGPGIYTIGWPNCCRNAAIINAAFPALENMFVYTDVTVYDPLIATNNTPVFLNEPVVFMPLGIPWSYNALPFDIDGDSLAWHMGIPQNYFDLDLTGYYLLPGDTSNPFTIDSITGTITWTPNTLGNWVTSIVVDEYRDGVLIGTIVRDMQMIVVPGTVDSLATFSDLEALPTDDDGYYFAELRYGDDYSLSLKATDPNPGDQLSLAATGGPFLFPSNPAEFEVSSTGVGNEIEGVFSWNPTLSQVRPENYLVVFRLDDGVFATDLAMLFRVVEELSNPEPGPGTGTEAVSQSGAIKLFPNPADGPVIVRIDQPLAGEVKLYVFDADGRLAMAPIRNTFSAGKHDVVIGDDLAPGQYWVAIEQGALRTARPLVIR